MEGGGWQGEGKGGGDRGGRAQDSNDSISRRSFEMLNSYFRSTLSVLKYRQPSLRSAFDLFARSRDVYIFR